jgi:hypothetical protein
MFAIVYKADGVPICVQVAGVSPDPVVVWNSEGAAKAFIESKGGAADYKAVPVDEKAMEAMAKALGCPVEKLMVEPYPG